MIIRSSQTAILEDSQYLAYETSLAGWLSEHFPEKCQELGANGVREDIRYLLQTAIRYGFEDQQNAARFVYLGFLLGRDFDLNPQYSSIQAKLADRKKDPNVRIEEAWNELVNHFEKPGDAIAVAFGGAI